MRFDYCIVYLHVYPWDFPILGVLGMTLIVLLCLLHEHLHLTWFQFTHNRWPRLIP